MKMRGTNCGTYLMITETDDKWPGCKEREEACCPNSHEEEYSAMTSVFVNAVEISEEDYNNKSFM